jgi:hypothetical protein
LALAIDPSSNGHIEGSTDSEAFFFLARMFGLDKDPPAAIGPAVGLIENVGRGRRVDIRSR